jgi:hypothetical protein
LLLEQTRRHRPPFPFPIRQKRRNCKTRSAPAAKFFAATTAC